VDARLTLTRPLELALTLGPIGSSGALRLDGPDAWYATRTPQGPASAHLHHDGDTLAIEAWGPGAEWLVASVPALCGEADDSSSFRPARGIIAELHRRHRGLRVPRTQAVFEALVPTVLMQQVTTIEAHASYRAIVRAFGEQAPGPVPLILPPAPAVLARTPYWAFHRFGVERRRADVIIRAARSVKRLEETLTMSLPDAYARLRAFPGVGAWSAAKVGLVAFGDPDAVPVGDYHLPHTVGYVLEGTSRSTDDRMLELLAPYQGHRGRVIRLITLSGLSAPKFGPHRPLRHIEKN
jgi:endonuclease III